MYWYDGLAPLHPGPSVSEAKAQRKLLDERLSGLSPDHHPSPALALGPRLLYTSSTVQPAAAARTSSRLTILGFDDLKIGVGEQVAQDLPVILLILDDQD